MTSRSNTSGWRKYRSRSQKADFRFGEFFRGRPLSPFFLLPCDLLFSGEFEPPYLLSYSSLAELFFPKTSKAAICSKRNWNTFCWILWWEKWFSAYKPELNSRILMSSFNVSHRFLNTHGFSFFLNTF